jgi:hypothetical protein
MLNTPLKLVDRPAPVKEEIIIDPEEVDKFTTVSQTMEPLCCILCHLSACAYIPMGRNLHLPYRVVYSIFPGGGGDLTDDLPLFVCVCICTTAMRILVNNYFMEVQ